MARPTADIQKTPPGVPPNWLTYVVVAKLTEGRERAKKLGGKVLMDEIVVPNMGATRLQGMFDAAGWQVLTVKYGQPLQQLFARPGGAALPAPDGPGRSHRQLSPPRSLL